MRSNLAISLDGKIATSDRRHFHLGSANDRRHLLDVRSRCDAVVFGAETLRSFPRPCTTSDKQQKIANVLVTRRLERISHEWPFFTSDRISRLILTTEEVSIQVKRRFEKVADVVQLSVSHRQGLARAIVDELGRRGYKSPIVEGGGTLIWEFVEANLIDEYHLTVTPQLIGGRKAPTLVDGVGFSANNVLPLHLRCVTVQGDELYLVYTRKNSRRLNKKR